MDFMPFNYSSVNLIKDDRQIWLFPFFMLS